jgi:hypothetical protein
VGRQETRSVGDAVISLAVLTFVLQGSFGEIENGSVLPRRRLPPPLGSLRYFDLDGLTTFARKIFLDDGFWNSQDAIPATTPSLGFAEVNDSRYLRESSNDSVFAALQDYSDIADCQEFRHALHLPSK